MFTDMVGFTASTQTDEAAALKRLREQERIVRSILLLHRGREIKSTGDGFLVEFDSALRATECAIAIQRRIHERNSRSNVTPIELRIGVHLGDVERRKGDIFGDAVNVASRIGPCATPGGVCISGPVFDQVQNKIPNQLEKIEPRTLKGLQNAIDVYRVVLPWGVSQVPTSVPGLPRLAVLPLTNISPDPKDEYFADGLTEELTSALSKIRELRVIARTSVGQYKATSKSVSQIGAELGVTSVLEGSVRKAGNRLRITLQLIDAGTQEHLWVNNYDRELDDVFAIQTDIAERTAGALRVELLGPERESIEKKPTANLAAYDLYLKGIHAVRQSTVGGWSEAIKLLGGAIQEDPGFSLAYSYLANLYIGIAGVTLSGRVAFPHAKELIAKAIELDPNSSDAHTALGNLALQRDQDWVAAEREFKTAIALNPSNALAHFWYGIFLRVIKRFGEATEEFRTAIELDPSSDFPRWGLANVRYLAGDMPSAIALAQAERDRLPEDPRNHLRLALYYARAGRMDDARTEAELALGPDDVFTRHLRAILRALLGDTGEARRLATSEEEAARSKLVNPSQQALLYLAIGEQEKAFEWVERDFQSGEKTLWFFYQDPGFDSIRDDSRFQAALKRMNLP